MKILQYPNIFPVIYVSMKNVVSQFVSNISPVSAPFQHLVTPWLLQTPSKRCTKSEQLLLGATGIYKHKDPFEDPIDIYINILIYIYINIYIYI